MQIINKLWAVMLAGAFALAGCGVGAGGFAVHSVDIADCVANPFDAKCEGAEFDDAKQYRLAFCSLAENAGHERCVDLGADANINTEVALETPSQDPAPALHPCESTPFSPNCGAIYETARQTRAEFCGQAGNATAPQCRGAIVSDPCILNPHGKDCDATYTDNRTQRVAFCAIRANTQNPICAPILSRPTFATWLHSFQTPLNTRANKTRAQGEYYAEFLQGTADGLDIGDVMKVYNGYSYIEAGDPRTSALVLAKDGGADGFLKTYLQAFDTEEIFHRYVGIFSGTDLGAPLPAPAIGAPTDAVWLGKILFDRVQRFNFRLNVDLANKSISASAKLGYRHRYSLQGIFNDRGVIEGNITYTKYNTVTGVLTGLIGEKGAVAVFKSDATPHTPYAGGFVANPLDQIKEFCTRDGNAGKTVCSFTQEYQPCIFDPFGANCGSEFETARNNRLAFCVLGENNDTPICYGAVAAHPCIRDPYDVDCGDDYDIVRIQRYDYCHTPNGSGSDTCDDFPEDFCGYKGNIIRADCADVARDSPCTVNPYGTNVFGSDCSSNYDTVRIQRYDFCAIPANKDEEVCRIFFGGFCRQEGNASQAICEETITANPCIGNPFASTCGISFKPDRAGRLAFCSIGDNANLPLCETADINGGCLINPYGYCGSNFASARTERYDFCTIEANAGNPLCNNFTLLYCGFGGNAGNALCADTITANPCIEDPFGDGCGADYLNARSSRINWCTIGTNANHPLCATGNCIQDPFTKSCVFGSYTQARDNRIDFCLQDANRDHALCTKLYSQATSLVWAKSFRFLPGKIPQAKDGIGTFLRGFRYHISTGDAADESDRPPTSYTLNLAHGAGNANLGGDADDGVGYFQYTPNYTPDYTAEDHPPRYYAGLLSNTDLGVPLGVPAEGGEVRATWAGLLGATNLQSPLDIEFDIDFVNKTFGGTTGGNAGNTAHYTIDSTFNATGVIQGSIVLARDSADRTGRVTGLIGEQGAVGAFISDGIEGDGYAGGFVAVSASKEFCMRDGNAAKFRCRAIVAETPCIGNPFGDTCGYRFNAARDNRLAFCSIGDNVNLPICKSAVDDNYCLRFPYGDCYGHFAIIRANWGDFCMIAANVDNPLCTDFTFRFCAAGNNASLAFCAQAVANDACLRDPFQSSCGFRYRTARDNRAAWCAQGTNASDVVCAADACLRNPFGQGCTYYYTARLNRMNFCTQATNKNHTLCAEILATPKVALWAQSLDTYPASAPSRADTGNKFLLGGELYLDTGDLFPGERLPKVWPSSTIDVPGGFLTDGYGYFQYTPPDGETRYYAGLLLTAEAGAPLELPAEGAALSATWSGYFDSTYSGRKIPIAFDVNFANRTFVGNATKDTARYTIDTTFNATGFLSGTIGLELDSVTSAGVVTGLIGDAGAIGAFISDAGVAQGYSGGFIVTPPSE